MIDRWRPRVLAAALLGTALMVLWWVVPDDAPTTRPESARAVAVPTPTTALAGADLTLKTTAPTTAAGTRPSAKLQTELMQAKDWRVFALSALARPEEGGYFYARHAAKTCRFHSLLLQGAKAEWIEASIEVKGTVSAAQLAAIDTMSTRCASFIKNETDAMVTSVESRAKDRRDPLLNALRDFDAAALTKDRSTLIATNKAIVALNDPLMVTSEQLPIRMTARLRPDGHNTVGFQVIDAPNAALEPWDFGLFSDAMALSACRDDAPCSIDEEILVGCAQSLCAATRRDFYVQRRQFFEEASTAMGQALTPREGSYAERLDKLTAQLRPIVQNGDFERLIKPSAPKKP